MLIVHIARVKQNQKRIRTKIKGIRKTLTKSLNVTPTFIIIFGPQR